VDGLGDTEIGAPMGVGPRTADNYQQMAMRNLKASHAENSLYIFLENV
jgi:hypothetical protein